MVEGFLFFGKLLMLEFLFIFIFFCVISRGLDVLGIVNFFVVEKGGNGFEFDWSFLFINRFMILYLVGLGVVGICLFLWALMVRCGCLIFVI